VFQSADNIILIINIILMGEMVEIVWFTSVPDHPLLHILSFLKYSDLAAYVLIFR